MVDDARGYDGPFVVVNPVTPRLTAWHVDMALADLEDGVDVSYGPGLLGGWYLAAFAAPHEEALDLLDGRGNPFGLGLELGLLRAERLLLTDEDGVALAKDPLLPQGVRALLRSLDER